MIKVVSKGFFYEDKISDALEIYEELVNETRKELGCISYVLYRDIADPTIMTMIVEWETEEHLNNHFNAEHFKRLVPLIGQMKINSELNKYVMLL